MLSGMGEQLISASYVFGSASVVFATLPFLFFIIKGIMDAKNQNTGSADILGVVFGAFIAHFISCVAFMTTIAILDVIGNSYSSNYFQDKVFVAFWTFDKAGVFSIAQIENNTVEAESAYLILLGIQKATKAFVALIPIAVLSVGIFYGIYQAKKDTYNVNILSLMFWTVASTFITSILFTIWAYIASYAMFIPDGRTLLDISREIWIEIVLNG